jgi:chloramphenicol O-acetyltransferase type B
MKKAPLLQRLKTRLGLGEAAEAQSLARRFPQFEIGKGSYGGLNVIEFGEGTTLKVGKYCSFAKGVEVLLGGNHRMDWVTTFPFSAIEPRFHNIPGHPHSRGDVVIGNDVWVAREAVILSGVTIGDGAVIGAHAVVSRDVSPYMIVAGNPAVPVRARFSSDTVDRLIALRWWDWPEVRIMAAMPLLLSPDIAAFLVAAERGEI